MRKIAGLQSMPRVESTKVLGKTERPAAEASPTQPATPAADLYGGEVALSKAEASPAASEVPAQAEGVVAGATSPNGKPAATGEPLNSELRKLARSINRVSAELARQGDPQRIEEVRTLVDGVLTHAPEAEKLIAQRRESQPGAAVEDLDAQIDALIGETTESVAKAVNGDPKPGAAKSAQDKHHRSSGHLSVPTSSAMAMTGSPQEKMLLQQQDAAMAAQAEEGDVKDDANIDDIIRGQKTEPMDPSNPWAAFYVPPEEVADSRAFACEPFASFTWNLIEHKSQQILELEQPLKAARKEIKQLSNELAEARETLDGAKEQLKTAKELGTDSPECKAALAQVMSAKEVVKELDSKLDTATEKAEVIESKIQTYAKTQSILMEVFKMFIDFLMQDIYRRKFD